jgi:hypothetical protein
MQPIEPPFIEMGQKYTFFYFCHFLIFVPGAAFLENKA